MTLSQLSATVLLWVTLASAVSIPSSPTSKAAPIDPAQVSISFEFFTFPDYTKIAATTNCLANIQNLRGVPPAIRIGGTTQDRATYDPNLAAAVNYTVSSSTAAPISLTYGPSFFTLASQQKGDVSVGLNRQLNNINNTRAAALQAKNTMKNLLAIEFGNEPDLYHNDSPIVPAGQSWSTTLDAASQQQWFTSIASSVGNIFQAGVYINFPHWSTSGLIPKLGSAINNVKTFSGHAYPQTDTTANLTTLMGHADVVTYVAKFASEATAAHGQGKKYFFGECNSATGGGGGISPTYGAGLWVMDYVLQATLNKVDRLYFHHGTLGACQYCWWGRYSVGAPYYGAVFVSEFFGTDGVKVAMLDDGTSAIGVYVVYNSANKPVRALIYNSNYFTTGTRSTSSVTLSGITSSSVKAKRLTAPASTSRTDQGAAVTIGGGSFDNNCLAQGTQTFESLSLSGGSATVSVKASEALIVYL